MQKESNFQVKIVTQQKNDNLTPKQKTFNRLIKKIEQERKYLAELYDTSTRYNSRYSAEYLPLSDKYDEKRTEFVHLLDNAYNQQGLNKNDKKKLAHIIKNIAEELIPGNNGDEMKEFYNKYSGNDYDEELEAQRMVMKDMVKGIMEGMLGVNLENDLDLDAPEGFIKEVDQKIQERREKQQSSASSDAGGRKKSAKTIEKEAREEAEQKKLSQSIREIFRQLAKELHPDREQDEQEKARKNALMQRVNIAYKENDLLKLLELQLEVEQIDQEKMNSLSDERLVHYNKILKQQLSEIEHEVDRVYHSFTSQYDLPYTSINPDQILKALSKDIKKMEKAMENMEKDIKIFQDIQNIKDWLKDIRIIKAQPRPFW